MSTTPCRWCKRATFNTGTRECDAHWELRRRIEGDLELATDILRAVTPATHRHAGRGTDYVVEGTATLQTTRSLEDGTLLVAYRSKDDGRLYVRPVLEFQDGRFKDFKELKDG